MSSQYVNKPFDILFRNHHFFNLQIVLNMHYLSKCVTYPLRIYFRRSLATTSLSNMAQNDSYQSGTNSIVYITTPNVEAAKQLSYKLVDGKYAACVNIIPQLTSIYKWEGKMNEDSELLLMVKTTTDKVDDLSKFVRENHPYSVPEVISVKIDNGNVDYLNWVTNSIKN